RRTTELKHQWSLFTANALRPPRQKLWTSHLQANISANTSPPSHLTASQLKFLLYHLLLVPLSARPNNPIVFASEEFTRAIQYGIRYALGRNCRFLQGPGMDPNSVRRLAQARKAGKELSEVLVNYRRDGSPFMDLLMIAPLMDSRGNIRYYIGAQVDVSGLIKDCSGLDGLLRVVEEEQDSEGSAYIKEESRKDEFQELSEMFDSAELERVRRHGGSMHKEYVDENDAESTSHGRRRRRLLLNDPSQNALDAGQRDGGASSIGSTVKEALNGKLDGVYQHYLLVRPAPSHRILFTSPSLRVPGVLAEGRSVTAKVRWLRRADEDGDGEGSPRWIHCTPLRGHSGAVGVWMIVLVDEESGRDCVGTGRRFESAPPVAANVGGKEDSMAYQSRIRERRTTRNL
ncbi:hypothetical protein LTR78_010975, partial [Recurvomyces mirabilis]